MCFMCPVIKHPNNSICIGYINEKPLNYTNWKHDLIFKTSTVLSVAQVNEPLYDKTNNLGFVSSKDQSA